MLAQGRSDDHMERKDLEVTATHPAAELFPMMGQDDLAALADDIRAHGLLNPIVRLGEMVLDGRNRLRACEMVGVEPRFVEWEPNGASPSEWVIAANLHRRHLSVGQRAAIAVEVRVLFEAEARETMGGRPSTKPGAPVHQVSTRAKDTARRAAELVGVSRRSVSYATEVQREAPDVFEQVKAGEKTVKAAVREVREPLSDSPPTVGVGPRNKREEIDFAASVRRMHRLFAGLEGYRRGMATKDLETAISAATMEDIAHWERTADDFLRTLRPLRNALRETRKNAAAH